MTTQILSGRLLVILDEGEENVGRIVQHKCEGDSNLYVPQIAPVVPPGEEAPEIPERVFYDHIVFVKEMSDEVKIGEDIFVGMKADAIIAVIPD